MPKTETQAMIDIITAKFSGGGLVLDVGCGAAPFYHDLLLSALDCKIISLDEINYSDLFAEKFKKNKRVEFINENVLDVKLESDFNIFLLFGVLHYFDFDFEVELVLSKLFSISKRYSLFCMNWINDRLAMERKSYLPSSKLVFDVFEKNKYKNLYYKEKLITHEHDGFGLHTHSVSYCVFEGGG